MYKINFIGWCHDTEKNHDKVWGYVTIDNRDLFNFWGRRGKSFTFKHHNNTWTNSVELRDKAREKCRAGRRTGSYEEVEIENIELLIPGFYEEFETQLVMAKLSIPFE